MHFAGSKLTNRPNYKSNKLGTNTVKATRLSTP